MSAQRRNKPRRDNMKGICRQPGRFACIAAQRLSHALENRSDFRYGDMSRAGLWLAAKRLPDL